MHVPHNVNGLPVTFVSDNVGNNVSLDEEA